MIEISNKENCCGCEACANICPKSCIKMIEDEEGFLYPKVDEEQCINCGLCEKVCPIQNKVKRELNANEIEFYAAYNKKDDIIKQSSSGGLFWILAEYIFGKKGVVYGVVQKSVYDVKYIRAKTKKECEAIMGSKYIQAKVGDIYNLCKKDLENDKYVLFSGTPCQIAALYKFLGNEYKKLYTIDVVCHGVPSLEVYREYIKYMEDKSHKKIIGIRWRDKINANGWEPNKITLFYEDNTKYTNISRKNIFQQGFLDSLYLRPSCYHCKYASIPRIGDISLGDFWGYDGMMKEDNNNKGMSAVIISTDKGKELFEAIKQKINFHPVSQKYLTERSRYSYSHPVFNRKRDKFFKDFKKISFDRLSKKYGMKETLIRKNLRIIKGMVRKLLKK